MKYFIITYGCQMNKSDSERIAAILEKSGYKETLEINEADLIVANMCSVRQSAVDRIYGLAPKFKELKQKNKKLKTVLTGCILKRDRQKFKNFFDFILNIQTLNQWPKIIKNKKITEIKKEPLKYLEIAPEYGHFPIAFVPISIGCNNFCTYCVVPYTRGREICRPTEKILSQIKDLAKKGFKEIWLLGEIVNNYNYKNKKKEIDFTTLLKMIQRIPGDYWLRFTSPHPKNFPDKLIETIARSEKITPYLNLPVQSGDNEILKRMNRGYTVEEYKYLVSKIRKAMPDISLSTDIIVGFPGETEKQFENTKKLMEEIKFDMAYISQFSPRPNTPAYYMKNKISKEEKERREKILTKILEKTALENNKKHEGKIVKVLITKSNKDFLLGKSFHHKTVKIKSADQEKIKIGDFVNAKIIKALNWGLEASL